MKKSFFVFALAFLPFLGYCAFPNDHIPEWEFFQSGYDISEPEDQLWFNDNRGQRKRDLRLKKCKNHALKTYSGKNPKKIEAPKNASEEKNTLPGGKPEKDYFCNQAQRKTKLNPKNQAPKTIKSPKGNQAHKQAAVPCVDNAKDFSLQCIVLYNGIIQRF